MYIWIIDNFIEIFGAITGIIYVFLEIRQNNWLWPLGIVTSGVYVWIFFRGKLYADMSLQCYYVLISILGWYWWIKGAGHRAQGSGQGGAGSGDSTFGEPDRRGQEDIIARDEEKESGREGEWESSKLVVTHLKTKTGIILSAAFVVLYLIMWFVLSKFTDSPVPEWDAFLTSLSIIATWMLARKIYEHWFVWIAVNTLSVILYFTRGLYPTVVLYFVYATMSFIGLKAWKKTINAS